jgi:hypothetical protein
MRFTFDRRNLIDLLSDFLAQKVIVCIDWRLLSVGTHVVNY